MCRGFAWLEPATTGTPGDRSRRRVARSCPDMGGRAAPLESVALRNHRRQPGRQPVGQTRRRDSAGGPAVPVPDPGRGGAAGHRLGLGWGRGRRLDGWGRALARVDDPGRMPRLGGSVAPGEVEVVSSAVAWIAVPPDPAPGW